MTRLSSLFVQPRVYLLAVALVFPIAIAVLIVRDGVDVPAYDEWTRLPLLVKMNAGTLSWGDLIAPLNEHRVLFPNILFVLLARLTGWNVKYEMAATLLVTCVTMVNLGLLGQATLGGTSIGRRVVFLLTSMLLFGPIQTDIWLWGIETAIVIPIACTTGCILLAQSRLPRKARLSLCLVLAGLATFSLGNGLLCWIVVLPILLLEAMEGREGRASLALWIVGMIVAWEAYFIGFPHKSLALGLGNPGRMLAYFWRFLGNPLAPRGLPVDPMVSALLIGALECVLFAAACVYFAWRRDARLARRMVPWVAVGLFAALSGTLVSVVRMNIETPLAVRYTTTAVLMPIALLYLVPIVCEHAWSRSYITRFTRRAIPAGLAAILIPLHVTTSITGLESAFQMREARRAGKAALMFVNLFQDEELLQITFEFGGVAEFNTHDRLGYMRPGLIRGGGIQGLAQTSGSAGSGAVDPPCGILERADRTTAKGWAVLPQKNAQADAVLLAFDGETGEPTPFAVAEVGIETSRPRLAPNDAYRTSGWAKAFPGKVPAMATKLFAWAVDTDSGKICSLKTKTGGNSFPLPDPGLPIDTIGVVTPMASGNIFSLRNSNTAGPADVTLQFGDPGDVPVAGDWDGNGITRVGVYRPRDVTFYLRNSNTSGLADLVIPYGAPGDLPVVGDWNGDGVATIGVYRPADDTFYLRNTNSPGPADLVIPYGAPGDLPIVGDWDGGGTTTIGVYRPSASTFYLRNANSRGAADMEIPFGDLGDLPVAGDFDGRGRATIGIYRPADGAFYLRNTNRTGPADVVARFGRGGRYAQPGGVPIIGDWDGR